MKEAIEQLIEELGGYKADLDRHGHSWNRGWNSALEMASKRLKEVIKSDADISSNGQTSPGSEDDTAEQV